MSSDLVADILNSAVATGTLALTSMTYRVAQATRQSAVDAASHRVLMTQFWINTKPRAGSAVADSGAAVNAGTSWNLTQYGGTPIGLQAFGHLRNEGAATAQLQFNCGPQAKVDSISRKRVIDHGPEVPEPSPSSKAGTSWHPATKPTHL